MPKIKQNDPDFIDKVKADGCCVDVIELPKIGIRGDTHMMMIEEQFGGRRRD